MTTLDLRSGSRVDDVPVTPDSPSTEVPSSGRVVRRLVRPVTVIRSVPHAATYAGVLLVSVGAVLLAVAWGKVAGLTDVSLQVPYVLSAGFPGLALVAAGLTVVNVAAKQGDARERTRQVGELQDLLAELRRAVEQDRQ